MRFLFLLISLLAIPILSAQSYKLSKILGSEYFKHDEPVRGVAFSCDDKYMVSSAGKEIILWDRVTAQKIKTINKMSHGVVTLAFSPVELKIAVEDSC
jgi:WD40 repeat protein